MTKTIAARACPASAKAIFGLKLAAILLLAPVAPAAHATDLLQAWQAAERHDRELAVARAAHGAAEPQRRQADALWRPTLGMTTAAGWGHGESQMRGAQFSAPGMGTNNGVDFGTSVNGGTATRVALQASQPLYDPERRAQQQQLHLQADMGELQWQAAQQAAMLRTAGQYLDLALAQESLRLLDGQLDAVRRAATEAQDRFDLGAAPITAVHEARAQEAQLGARRLAAQAELDIQRRRLADSTGLPDAGLVAHIPQVMQPTAQALALWQEQAAAGNPGIRLQQLAADLARAEADKHRASAAPRLELVAQAAQDRLSGSGDYGSGARNKDRRALLGVQLTVPLYTGGYRSAKEDESLARWNEAQARLDATREQVARQVHAAWLGLRSGEQQVQALQQALQASRARQDATRTGYEVGHRTLLDLLGADNDLAATQLALAQAMSRLLLAELQLAQLAGRLDEAALRRASQSAPGDN